MERIVQDCPGLSMGDEGGPNVYRVGHKTPHTVMVAWVHRIRVALFLHSCRSVSSGTVAWLDATDPTRDSCSSFCTSLWLQPEARRDGDANQAAPIPATITYFSALTFHSNLLRPISQPLQSLLMPRIHDSCQDEYIDHKHDEHQTDKELKR